MRFGLCRTAIVLGCVLAAATACGNTPARGDGLTVVASFYPLEELAGRIGGDRVRVRNLTPPGAEPHDVELRPSDVIALKRSNLVLYFGGGFQPSVERVLRQGSQAKTVDVLAQMTQKKKDDPHVWLSPSLMQVMAGVVQSALESIDPQHREEFAAATARVRSDLQALDSAFRDGLASCERREIITSHDAFAYLAESYGLRQVAIAGIDPEAEPSSQRLQEVAAAARRAHATTIFFETLVSPRVAQAVARIAGARTAVLNPVEGLAEDERVAGKTYFSVMGDNLRSLQKALGCES